MVKVTYVCKKFSELYGNDSLYKNAAGCCVFSDIKDTADFDFYLGMKNNPDIRE